MKIVAVAFLLGLTLLFYSCQPEIDPVDLGGDPPIVSVGNILWKYSEVDTTEVTGLDTVENYYYEYDSQTRIQRVTIESDPDTTLYVHFLSYYEINYFYDPSGTEPFKSTNESFDDNGFSTYDTVFYAYQNGMVKWDSAIYYTVGPLGTEYSVTVRTFNTSGSNTVVDEKKTTYGPGSPTTCDNSYNYTNTVSGAGIINEGLSITGCTTGTVDWQCDYDNKINPLYSTILHYPVFDRNEVWGVQQHNTTERKSVSLNINEKSYYTYRSDGRPLIVRKKDLAGGNDSKGIYFYKL